MEKIYYDKLFDFSISRAIKMQNSSYLEDLTGLFFTVSNRLDKGLRYCFGDSYYLEDPLFEPNSSYKDFIDSFKNSFYSGDSGKIHIIRGRAGV